MDDDELQTRAAAALLLTLYGSEGESRMGSKALADIGGSGGAAFTGVMMTCALAVANVIRCTDPEDRPADVDLARIVQAEGVELRDDHPGLNAVRCIVSCANGDVPLAADIVGTYVDRVEIHGHDPRAINEVAKFAAAMLTLGRSIVQALDPDQTVTKLHAAYADYDR